MLLHILEGFAMRIYGCYDADTVSAETAFVNTDPSMAVQSQKAECDINNIVRDFGVTGKLPGAVRAPEFGDFSEVDDYQSALDALRSAEASFMLMDAEVRARFRNDPQAFVEFCSDSANLEEMRSLGLAPAAAVAPASA